MPRPTKLHRIPPAILQRSRDFRHPLTPTENKVWQAVRRRQLGFKFRRQHPIGKFITDFRRTTRLSLVAPSACAEAYMVIEIDRGCRGERLSCGGRWNETFGCDSGGRSL